MSPTESTTPEHVEAPETAPEVVETALETARGIEETPEDPETVDEQDPETVDEQDADPRLAKVRNEARNLRTRLKAVEGERDAALKAADDAAGTLAAALDLRDSVTRAEVERLAHDLGMADGADLWNVEDIDGPAAFLQEGTNAVDTAKVEAVVAEVLEAHPHWSRAPRLRFGQTPVEALGSGQLRSGMGAGFGSSSGRGWGEVLKS